MTYIKIDTDRLKTVIDNLEEYAAVIDDERQAINRVSEDNHDPVASVVTATEAAPGFLVPGPGSSTLAGNAVTIRTLADELRCRRQEVIDMNESGITMTNPDGTLSYYLPDPPPGTIDLDAYWRATDTVANVHSYNTGAVEAARAEAAELQEALEEGKSSRGRRPDEILDEIDKHRDIPTYGAAFVDAIGTEEFLNLAIDAQTRYRDVDDYGNWVVRNAEDDATFQRTITSLGHVLAAASQPEVNGESQHGGLSLEISELVTTDGKQGLATAVTALMSVPGTAYGTDFIVNLASDLESVDYDEQAEDGAPTAVSIGPYLGNYSPDPLSGPLLAMSRNPEAADKYFTPTLVNPPIVINENGESTIPITDYDPTVPFTTRDGRTTTAQERSDYLLSRSWPVRDKEALTAAYATVSSQRGSTDGGLDGRATWACGQALEAFGNHDFSGASDRTKTNLGVFVGNHAAELTGMAVENNPDRQFGYISANDSEHDSETKRETLKYIVADIADSDNAVSAAGQGIMDYTERAARAEASEDLPSDVTNATPEQIEKAQQGMNRAYTNGQSAAAWVDAVAEAANERSDTERSRGRAQAGAAFTALGAIPHPAASLTSALGSAGISLAEAQSHATVVDLEVDSTAYNASIVEVAAQHGLVDESRFPSSEDPQSWYDPEDKSITITDSTRREEFQQWWAENSDDIGLTDSLMTVSQTAVTPQDTDLPADWPNR